MSACYHQVQVEVDAGSRNLRVRCRVENSGDETWRAGEVSLGCQIADPDTGVFLREGEWLPLGEDLAPDGTREFALSVAIPAERGCYRVQISPIHKIGGWDHQRGLPFLAVDCGVDGGRASVAGWRVTTRAAEERYALKRVVVRALTLPALSIWNNRGLIRSMVRRDVLARYRGSFGDVLWTVLNPLLLMATYFFVFGIVLRARFGGDPSRMGFALYFLAGMLPWLAFSEAAGRAPNVVADHRNFIKKLVFPVETLPVTQVIAGLVTECFALGVFLAALVATRGGIPVTVLWLPALLVPQLLFTLGMSWLLAATGAFVRDLGHVIGFLLTLWFFLTPICYPEASLPPAALGLLGANPMFVLVRGYRAIFLEGQAPAWTQLAKLTAVSVVVFVAGHAWFHKLRRSFADVV